MPSFVIVQRATVQVGSTVPAIYCGPNVNGSTRPSSSYGPSLSASAACVSRSSCRAGSVGGGRRGGWRQTWRNSRGGGRWQPFFMQPEPERAAIQPRHAWSPLRARDGDHFCVR